MKILLKNATILDPSSPFHSTSQDLLIQNGEIAKISNDIIDTDNTKAAYYKKVIAPSVSEIKKHNEFLKQNLKKNYFN